MRTLHVYRHALGVLVSSLLLAVPAAVASAAAPPSGGSGLGGPPTSGSPGQASPTSGTAPATAPTGTRPAASAHPLNDPVSASGDGITISTQAIGVYAQTLRFTGTAPTSDAGHTVVIERRRAGQAGWRVAARATVAAGGTFTATWRPDHMGHDLFAASVLSPGTVRNDAMLTAGTPSVTVTVIGAYRATWYGPGFFGRRTACGQRLTRVTLGVASRHLRCGTRVTLLYAGKEITVPVIDRGPFADGASWDLTEATAEALGITETTVLGATW
jgi:hypothetical protein